MGVIVPDDELKRALAEIPAFRGANGQYDPGQARNVLRNNGLSEQGFLDMLRTELAQRQVLDAVRAGSISPDTLTKAVFAFQNEQRVAQAVLLAFSAAPPPPAPTDAQLQRWYDNHKPSYSTPEFRRIKAIILSSDTVARELSASDEDIAAAYALRKDQYVQPEKRDVAVILSQDEAHARALAAQWQGGADWAAMQAAAQKSGDAAVELPDATRSEFPAAELADAVFSAQPNVVSAPVHSALGWHVFRVNKITPPSTIKLDDVRTALKDGIVAERAADLVYERASKLTDLLTAGTPMDDLPGDMGLGAIAGTLDAQGITADGNPAPIPGAPSLRAALITEAFKQKLNEAPKLIEVPRQGNEPPAYFAVTVEAIDPPAAKPLADVKEQVVTDWTEDARRHEQDEAAAKLLAAVKGGQSLAAAAGAAGLVVQTLPATSRATPAAGVPNQLLRPLFDLKLNEATMIELPEGFMVAQLTAIQPADPAADALGYGKIRDAMARAIGEDTQATTIQALRDRGKPRVNPAMLNGMAQVDQ